MSSDLMFNRLVLMPNCSRSCIFEVCPWQAAMMSSLFIFLFIAKYLFYIFVAVEGKSCFQYEIQLGEISDEGLHFSF